MANIKEEAIVFAGSIKGDSSVEYRSESINAALHGFCDAEGALTEEGKQRVDQLLRNAFIHAGVPEHLMCREPKGFGGRGTHDKVLVKGLCGDCVETMNRVAADKHVLSAFQ